ncbi:MAG: hypothetical protein KF756_03200 [Acidobacteria bacterium]|nr:hypothetical protein [Acidobacteriota bacterium]
MTMKTRFTLLLAFLIVGACMTANGQSLALTNAYNTWKAAVTKQHDGTMPDSYSLTSITERSNAQQATVKFLVTGKIPTLDLVICPLTIIRGADGRAINILRGEQVTARQKLNPESAGSQGELNTTVPVDAQNNGVEVTWKFNAEGKAFEYTMILPLDASPTANVLGIVPSNGNSTAGKPLCPADCYELSASTERSGSFYNCSRTLIGNSIDLTTSPVTCGQGR